MTLQRIALPFGGNSACPLWAEASHAMPDEVGPANDHKRGALVLKDTNGAPILRLSLAILTGTAGMSVASGEVSPGVHGLTLMLFTPVELRPVPFGGLEAITPQLSP